tara:strand:+ start:211 stop:567 length:357 start_codon:yes stop_codon:yes gene_type:complete
MSSKYNKRRSVGKNKFQYVCEPNSIKIIAQIAPSAHGKINVTLYINEKEALFGSYRVIDLEMETINNRVATFCDGLALFTEEDIQSYITVEKSTLARHAYRSLKEVRNKLGRLIWKRS